MKASNKSFSTRLSFNVVLLTSLLFIGALLVAALSSHKLLADEATKSAANTLDANIAEIERVLQGVEMSVRDAAWLAQEHLDDPEYLYHITSKVVSENPDIVGSAIAFRPDYFPGEYYFSPYSYNDVEGNVVTKQLGSQSYDYFYMDWFQIPALLGKPCWGEPYYDEGGAEALMSTYSIPLLDESGETYAVVTGDITLQWISDMIAGIQPYEGSYTMLVSRCGSFVGHRYLSELAGESLLSATLGNTGRNIVNLCKAMLAGEKGVLRVSQGKRVSFAVYGPLSNGWSAAIICPYRSVLARTTTMHLILLLLALFGLGLIFLLCYSTIRKLTKPLSEISDSALSVAAGNFHTKLPQVKNDDEVKRLRDSFETMQNSLTDYIEELKSTTATKERFESELNIARGIQMNMVPRDFPKLDDVDVYALLNPAKEVGGDLYDFQLRGRSLYFAIGDVSGKGVPASLFMAITRSACRFISGMDIPLSEVVTKINDSICDGNDATMFVTLLIGILNLETGELQYCNAGHNAPVIVTPDGKATKLPVKSNLAIGVFEGFTYQAQSLQLAPGSSIVLYTDGVTEAETSTGSQYGDDRLLAWAEGADFSASSHELTDKLLDSVREFTAGNEQNDDITIMTIKYGQI